MNRHRPGSGSRPRWWPWTLLLSLVFVFVVPRAYAQDQSSVRIAVAVSVAEGEPLAPAELSTRLTAELTAAGHQAVPWTDADLSLEALLQRARDEDCAIAVGVVVPERPAPVELRVVDRMTGKQLMRSLPGSEGRLPSVVALAATELVDASLAELWLAPPSTPVPREVEIPPGLRLPRLLTPAPPPRWEAELGLGILWPVSQDGVVASARLATGVRATERIVITARVASALHPQISTRPGARLSSMPMVAGLGPRIDLLDPDSDWRLAIDGAIALTVVIARGEVDEPLTVQPVNVASAAATAGLVLRRRLGTRWFVAADASVVIPFVAPRLRVTGEAVQDYGPVWLLPTLGGGARW